MMTPRQVLPQRRSHEVFEFAVDGIRYTAGVGRFADDRVAEVFMSSTKNGTAADTNARDGAILLSFLMQHGVDLAVVAPALTRGSDGRPLGPIGHVVDHLAKELTVEIGSS